MSTANQRKTKIKRILKDNYYADTEGYQTALVDLLADCLHFAHKNKAIKPPFNNFQGYTGYDNFDCALSSAVNHFYCEGVKPDDLELNKRQIDHEDKKQPSQLDRIKQYRAEHKCSLKDAHDAITLEDKRENLQKHLQKTFNDAVTKPINPTKRQTLPTIK